ncbi:Protein of unknown function [Propionibacterium freudenreichii]|nr:Protein of unknown function [Propionibacterium freudenreichii]
MSTATTDST